jgi:hypothetical protein
VISREGGVGLKVGSGVGDEVGFCVVLVVGWIVGVPEGDREGRKLGFGVGGHADQAGETVGNGIVTLLTDESSEGYQWRHRSSDFL